MVATVVVVLLREVSLVVPQVLLVQEVEAVAMDVRMVDRMRMAVTTAVLVTSLSRGKGEQK